jgi:hypothetical protein
MQLYLAAHTFHAYNTVVMHRQQEKSNHQIHHGVITKNKTTQQEGQDNNDAQTHKEQKGARQC